MKKSTIWSNVLTLPKLAGDTKHAWHLKVYLKYLSSKESWWRRMIIRAWFLWGNIIAQQNQLKTQKKEKNSVQQQLLVL